MKGCELNMYRSTGSTLEPPQAPSLPSLDVNLPRLISNLTCLLTRPTSTQVLVVRDTAIEIFMKE
jgi:hypothetical protein